MNARGLAPPSAEVPLPAGGVGADEPPNRLANEDKALEEAGAAAGAPMSMPLIDEDEEEDCSGGPTYTISPDP